MALCVPLTAQEADLPRYSGYVNDFAGVLGEETAGYIESISSRVSDKTTAQIAVVTVSTTQPLTIEQYAVRLFEKWGIGLKDEDNGVLLLVAIGDRKVRIETGYGLEGALPDAVCSSIIEQIIIPEFRQNDYEKGILYGIINIAQLVAREYNIELKLDMPAYAAAAKRGGNQALKILFYLIFFMLFFGMRSGLLFFLILGPTGRRRGGYWYGSGYSGGGSSFGGGFGGFGGGFSGGGGASGGW